MSWKRRLRPVIDIAMTVSMPVLMAYELAGAALHEYLGIAIFILFVAHHALNFGWIKGITKGHYLAPRLLNLIVNLLLLVIMLLLPVSGIMMSRHAFVFLNLTAGVSVARTIHLLASYWGFLLMSLHIGFHWNAMRSALERKNPKNAVGIRKIMPHILTAVIFIYGIYAFAHRRIADYLFLKSQFVFFDYSEPLIIFLLDYAAIMVMVACVGYYLMLVLRKQAHKNSCLCVVERNEHI